MRRSGGASDEPAMTDRQYQSLARFRHALRVFLRFSEVSARNAGLTPSQHQLLLAVRGWQSGSAPAIGDLAEMLQITPHAALELARRVEAADLVRIKASPDDRRRQLVSLTARGQRKLEELSTQHRDELRRFRKEMDQVLAELD